MPISILMFGFLTLTSSQNASAYSATLTTGTDIKLNASPSGDGTSIHEESINVVSDCRAGYNLSIATPEGSNLYTNGDGSTTAVFTAVDGTSALNSTNNTNKWGYTLTSSPTSSTVFSPLSSTQSVLKTASQTANPNANINDTFSINYGVKVDNTIVPGSYKMANNGTIVYYLTMATTCNSYIVQYQGNNADNPNGMGTTDSSTGEKSVKQINIERDTKITLLPSNFKKAGYGFLGWSTDSDAYTHFTDNDNTNDPIIYGPMEDVVIDSTMIATANNRNQINMYAVWVPALKDGSNNTVYFQDWDNPNTNLPNDGCSTLTRTTFDDTVTDEKGKIAVAKDSFTALTDKRDNEVYTVARLADGNCWMTENLRLEHEGTVGNNINDPNVTNQSLSQGYGGTTGTYGNFVGLAASESANFDDTTTSLSFADGGIYKSDGSGDVFNSTNSILEDIGTSDYPGYRFPRYNNSNNFSALQSPIYSEDYSNASSPSASGVYKDSTVSSYGNYYTWAVAMANTNYYSDSFSSEAIGTSICPSSWHLPSSNGATKEYGILSASYGGTGYIQESTDAGSIMVNRFRTFPNNFLYSGYYDGSSANGRGSNGDYCSRSAGGRYYSYYLNLRSIGIHPSDYYYDKTYGFSVRCLIGSADVQVVLDSNNDTGAVSKAFGTAGSTITLPSSSNPSAAIAKPGYGFKNWNTTPDGLGTSYTSNFTIPAGSTGETLYAQWTPQRQIIYNDNCSYNNAGCATSIDATNTSSWTNAGSNITLGSGTYFTTKSGYIITSWNTARDGSGTSYNVSSIYTVPSTLSAPDQITLYAQWSPVLTVNFNSNGGSGTMTSQLIPENTSKALKNNSFTAPSGNYFIGWMTEESRVNNEVAYTNGATYTAPTTVTPGDSITLYAKWGPRYTIVYNGNNATGGSMVSDGTELKHTNINEGNSINLYAPNYWKTNYGFVGWSPSPTATIGGTDPIYGPMESISAPSYDTYGEEISGTKTITLYAIWLEADSAKTMQTFTNTDCQNLSQTTFNSTTSKITAPAGSVIALKDQRDNNVYTVARLADGNCWMIENLRLEAENTVGNNQYDTSVTNESLSQGYGGVFAGLDSTENANFDSVTIATPNRLYNGTNITGSYPRYRFPRYNNNNTNTNLTASYNGEGSSTYYSWYSYGNYYTWAAAMVNTTYYSSATGVSGSESANTSICPTNWTLPTSGNNTTDFDILFQSYQGDTSTSEAMSKRFRSFPNNFLNSGIFYDSSAGSRGSIGYYWSKSAYNDGISYYLTMSFTNLRSSASNSQNNNKFFGYSVRCLIGS
ncbi:InlB B-repeat-containing protein [Candidatus Saccharibacteria bacterium]|nr:InlB B-repeat-containing protein [Candidatus Saccharibacteria bacterium]